MGTAARRHFAHVHHTKSASRISWSLDPGPRDPAAVEPSNCSSESQDLAEPDILDADAVFFDFAQTFREGVEVLFDLCKPRYKIPKCFFVIFESIRDIQVVMTGICEICFLNCSNGERRASNFSSVVISGRVPITKIRRRNLHG